MNAFFVLLVAALALPYTVSGNTQCVRKGRSGDCGFYQCFERKKGCGEDGYLIGYGYKYCTRFDETYNSFTAQGKKWIGCVRKCLTNHLVPWYQSGRGTCKALKTSAFDSHVQCYVNCGFCQICKNNKWALFKTYSIFDFASRIARNQVKAVMKQCGGTFSCM